MGVDSLATLIHFFVMIMIIFFYTKLERKMNQKNTDENIHQKSRHKQQ